MIQHNKSYSNKVKLFFDNTDNYLKNNYNIFLRKNIIKTLIGSKKGRSILDVGCGNGELSINYLIDNEVDFFDLSKSMLDIIKNKLKNKELEKSRFINGEFLVHNFDKKYDAIIIIGVLAHVDSIESVVKKASRLLNKDGTVIFQITNNSNIMGKLLIFYYNFISKIKNTHLLNSIKLKDFLNTLDNCEMKVEEFISYSSLLPGMGKLSPKLQKFFQKKTLKNYVSIFGSEVFIKVRNKQ